MIPRKKGVIPIYDTLKFLSDILKKAHARGQEEIRLTVNGIFANQVHEVVRGIEKEFEEKNK